MKKNYLLENFHQLCKHIPDPPDPPDPPPDPPEGNEEDEGGEETPPPKP
ncbi:MAG: hypothetical protein JEY97_11005 [Bacteroidales bacterium]|nr:hypothetical protein [Bacteroidales bacterium]